MNPSTPWFPAFLLMAVGVSGSAAEPPAVPITQIDISRFPEVTIFFKPIAGNGTRLAAIAQNQVEVFEDDTPVTVTQFQGYGSFNVRTVLLLDTSGSMSEAASPGRTKLDAAREAGRAFLNVSRPGDEVAILHFDTRVHILSRLAPVTADTSPSLERLVANGNTAWRDAVVEALNLVGTLTGRRNVILLTDGQDNSSRHTVRQVTDLARKYQVPIHAIGLGDAAGIDEREMRSLADESGGQYLRMPDAERLTEFYTTLGKSVQDEASVTYQSRRPTPDGTRRRIRLVIHTPEGTVVGGSDYLERHLLNIQSHPAIFALFALFLGLLYCAPPARQWWRERPWRLAADEARQEPPKPADPPPTLSLTASVHPLAVPVDHVTRSVTCRLDISATQPPTGHPRFQPLALAVLLDLSASMTGERLEAARAALRSLFDGLDDDDTFCLIGFHATAELIVPLTRVGRVRPLMEQRLRQLRTGTSTVLTPALDCLAGVLPPAHHGGRRKWSIIVVSDGKVEDAVRAAAARARLPEDLTVAAIGIGVDYDHQLLAHICGSPRMVDHLDSAGQAIEAFTRFVALYGHTLTARSRLHFRPAPGVVVHEVTAVRHVRTLPMTNDEVVIDDLPGQGQASYLIKFLLTPATPGQVPLADIVLTCDLPGYGLSDLRCEARTLVEVTGDALRANAANPAVMQTIRLVMAGKMIESAEQQIEKGDAERAKATLRQATRRYQEAGADQQADTVARFLQALPADANPDRVTKGVRGLTKRVTE